MDLRSKLTIYGKWTEKCGFSLSFVAGIQSSLKEMAETDVEKDEMASKIEGLFRKVLEINREVHKENKAKGLKFSQQLAVALHNVASRVKTKLVRQNLFNMSPGGAHPELWQEG